MELDPIHTQLKNGKCSVYNRITAFPLVASAMQIDELCATQQILLPQGLNATECIQPPKCKKKKLLTNIIKRFLPMLLIKRYFFLPPLGVFWNSASNVPKVLLWPQGPLPGASSISLMNALNIRTL